MIFQQLPKEIFLIILKGINTIDLINLQEVNPYLKQLIQEQFWNKVNDSDQIIYSLTGLNKDNYTVYDEINKNGSIDLFIKGHPRSSINTFLIKNGFNPSPGKIINYRADHKYCTDFSGRISFSRKVFLLMYLLEYIVKTIIIKMGRYDIDDKWKINLCFEPFNFHHPLYHSIHLNGWTGALLNLARDNKHKDLKLIGELAESKDIVEQAMKEIFPNLQYKIIDNTIEIPLDSITDII